MQLAMLAVALFVFQLLSPTIGTSLRQRGGALSFEDPETPASPASIKEKWDKMDEFLEVMFTMACKWKNGKDIAGEAAEKLRNGELDGADEYHAYIKEMQEKNVKGLERSCGLIVASQKKKCREGCATRWNANIKERQSCDGKCIKVYENFETSCKEKADNLVKVYDMKNTKAAAQKQCYEGHCKEFPMVWLKTDEEKMKDEVDKQCTSRCTDDNVKAGCQRQWILEVDLHTSSVGADCAEESEVKTCFDDKKMTASTNYDTCKSDTKSKCDADHSDCTAKGDQAKAFCDDRKKMCQEQADKKCLDANKADLEKAQKECEAEAATALKTCKDTKLSKMKDEHEADCIKEEGPKCKGKCEGKCNVEKMNKCLFLTKSEDDPGKMFCKDFWHLLHSSSEVDPVTGNPIVLLSTETSALAPAI